MIRDLEEVISLTESAIAELKPASAPPSSRLQKAPPSERNDPPVEKWSKEKHPAYQAGYKPPNAPTSPTVEDTPVVFSVNDPVLAKWKSGDKSFYPARITSITGSSTNPVYIVTFKNYATTETLRASDLKAIANPSNQSNKRKADGPSTTPTGSSQSNNGGGVISKGANIDESLVGQAKREPSKVSDGPIRPAKIPRKVKANKELEQGKNNWQKFSANPKKWKAGVGKKDSMFRTGEGVNARGESNPTFPYFFCLLHGNEERD